MVIDRRPKRRRLFIPLFYLLWIIINGSVKSLALLTTSWAGGGGVNEYIKVSFDRQVNERLKCMSKIGNMITNQIREQWWIRRPSLIVLKPNSAMILIFSLTMFVNNKKCCLATGVPFCKGIFKLSDESEIELHVLVWKKMITNRIRQQCLIRRPSLIVLKPNSAMILIFSLTMFVNNKKCCLATGVPFCKGIFKLSDESEIELHVLVWKKWLQIE